MFAKIKNLFKKKTFIELPTVKGYSVYIRKTAVIRVWNDENVTAIMYSSNAVDHIKLSLKDVLDKLS